MKFKTICSIHPYDEGLVNGEKREYHYVLHIDIVNNSIHDAVDVQVKDPHFPGGYNWEELMDIDQLVTIKSNESHTFRFVFTVLLPYQQGNDDNAAERADEFPNKVRYTLVYNSSNGDSGLEFRKCDFDIVIGQEMYYDFIADSLQDNGSLIMRNKQQE